VDKKNWDKNDNCSNSNLANLHRLIGGSGVPGGQKFSGLVAGSER
jgi:hypothetical protein